jgi:hypothetical protein
MMTGPAGAGQAGPMSDGLSGLVNRIIAWTDCLQAGLVGAGLVAVLLSF